MVIKEYLSMCAEEGKKTPHIIYMVRINRGVKLRCVNCGEEQKRYCNPQKLKLIDEKGGEL